MTILFPLQGVKTGKLGPVLGRAVIKILSVELHFIYTTSKVSSVPRSRWHQHPALQRDSQRVSGLRTGLQVWLSSTPTRISFSSGSGEVKSISSVSYSPHGRSTNQSWDVVDRKPTVSRWVTEMRQKLLLLLKESISIPFIRELFFIDEEELSHSLGRQGKSSSDNDSNGKNKCAHTAGLVTCQWGHWGSGRWLSWHFVLRLTPMFKLFMLYHMINF